MNKKDNKFDSNFGGFIRLLRESKGLRIKDIAQKSNLSIPYISRLECNVRKRPSFHVLKRLANGLEVPVMDLLLISLNIDNINAISLKEFIIEGNYTINDINISQEVKILLWEIIEYIISEGCNNQEMNSTCIYKLIDKIKHLKILL